MKKMKIVFCLLYFIIAFFFIYITIYPTNKIIEGKTNIFASIKKIATKVGDNFKNSPIGKATIQFGTKVGNTGENLWNKSGIYGWGKRTFGPSSSSSSSSKTVVVVPPPPPPVNGQVEGNSVYYIPKTSSQYYADLSSRNLIQSEKGVYLYRVPTTDGYKPILTVGPIPPP
jgi:hypothetical protein